MFQNVPKMFQNVPKMFQNVPKCSKRFQNVDRDGKCMFMKNVNVQEEEMIE